MKRKLEEERTKARESKWKEQEATKARKQQVQVASRWMKRIVKMALAMKHINMSKFAKGLDSTNKNQLASHTGALEGLETVAGEDFHTQIRPPDHPTSSAH